MTDEDDELSITGTGRTVDHSREMWAAAIENLRPGVLVCHTPSGAHVMDMKAIRPRGTPLAGPDWQVVDIDFDGIEERVISQIVDEATASERIRETLVIGGNRYGNRTAMLAMALTLTAGTRSFFEAPPTTWGGFCEPVPAYEPPQPAASWPTKAYSNNADPFSRHIDGRHPTKARKVRKKKSKK